MATTRKKKSGTTKSGTKKTGAKKTAAKKKAPSAKRPGARKTAAKRRYGPAASESVATELHELKEGTLRSGSGQKVTNRQQAIAIGLSEARRAGAKVPPRTGRKKK
jgi:hypothetical protein